MIHHYFDIELAKEYGILQAILFENILFWITKNEANGQNFHDGRYWTYNSTKAFAELFPYATPRQIQTALKDLKDKGLLMAGEYNTSPYDHTLWYALTDLGYSIIQKCKIDTQNLSNRQTEIGESLIDNNKNIDVDITDINTDVNTDIEDTTEIAEEKSAKKRRSKPFVKPTIEEMVAYFKEKHLNGDPEKCWWYYESCGWVVGEKPMKSWKGSCQTWSRNEKNYRPKNKYGKKDTMEYYDTSDYDNLPF